jgi:hypothetical protein
MACSTSSTNLRSASLHDRQYPTFATESRNPMYWMPKKSGTAQIHQIDEFNAKSAWPFLKTPDSLWNITP